MSGKAIVGVLAVLVGVGYLVGVGSAVRGSEHPAEHPEAEPKPPTIAEVADHIRDYVEWDKKLKGGYALIRTGAGKDTRWLLIKMKDDGADARRNPVSTEPESVLTGRTLKEIAEAERDKDDS